MASFDIVSEVDAHEISNAVDQANKEVQTRFDFKGSDAHFGLENQQIELQAQNDFQIKQMQDILHAKLAKREVDSRCGIDRQRLARERCRNTYARKTGVHH